jgi:hypothetical protein
MNTPNKNETPHVARGKSKLAADFNNPAPAAGDSYSANFITNAELRRRLFICRKTALNWEKYGLPNCKIRRRKLYHWPTVENWLLRHQRGGGL